MSEQDLTLKYRPATFDQVIGQDNVIEPLKKIIELDKKLPACLLFSGPSGTGKTTLARIAAKAVGCIEQNIIEIDAASHTGVDDMRGITEQMKFLPLGSRTRVIILDEAQRLSKQAFDSLLKSVEEPPQGTSWIFCSTEPKKLPHTIQTRTHHFELKKVSAPLINNLLIAICQKEKIDVDKKILNLVAVKAAGSPRQAITLLSMVRGCSSIEKAQELIKVADAADENVPVMVLCRTLLKRDTAGVIAAIKELVDEDNEGVRMIVLAYMTKVALSAGSGSKFDDAVKIIYAFSPGGSFNASEKCAPVLLASMKYLGA